MVGPAQTKRLLLRHAASGRRRCGPCNTRARRRKTLRRRGLVRPAAPRDQTGGRLRAMTSGLAAVPLSGLIGGTRLRQSRPRAPSSNDVMGRKPPVAAPGNLPAVLPAATGKPPFDRPSRRLPPNAPASGRSSLQKQRDILRPPGQDAARPARFSAGRAAAGLGGVPRRCLRPIGGCSGQPQMAEVRRHSSGVPRQKSSGRPACECLRPAAWNRSVKVGEDRVGAGKRADAAARKIRRPRRSAGSLAIRSKPSPFSERRRVKRTERWSGMKMGEKLAARERA